MGINLFKETFGANFTLPIPSEVRSEIIHQIVELCGRWVQTEHLQVPEKINFLFLEIIL